MISVKTALQLVANMVKYLSSYGLKTEIIAASIRNLDHVNQVMLAGAQIATIPTNVLEQMLLHPLTDKGLENFCKTIKQFCDNCWGNLYL